MEDDIKEKRPPALAREATPEAIPEATAEAIPEATAEAIPEATAEALPEATEAAPRPESAAVVEPAPAATPAATPAALPEATEAAPRPVSAALVEPAPAATPAALPEATEAAPRPESAALVVPAPAATQVGSGGRASDDEDGQDRTPFATKRRLFLAIVPTIEVAAKIAQGISTMRKRAKDVGIDVKWVAPANLHVTLKFLGWTRVETIGVVSDLVHECLAGKKGLELHVAGVGAFPEEGQARVLWAGVKDDEGVITDLANAIDGALAKVGIAAEERAFHPHVTMGRVKRGEAGRDLILPFAGVTFGHSLVREVILYESTPQAVGAEYVVLRRFAMDVPAYRVEPTPEAAQSSR